MSTSYSSDSSVSQSRATTPFARKPLWKTVAIVIIALLICLRVAAPFVLKSAVNKRLGAIPDYDGKVGGIHLSVIRGAYRLNSVKIVKRQGDPNQPFFAAKSIDFSIAWRDLFRGQLVSDIYIEDGQLTFLNSSNKQASQLETDKRWQDVVKDLFPIDITHCEIHHGVLRFVDVERQPKVDIAIHDLRLVATGLRNRPQKSGEEYPAKIDVSGTVLGSGALNIGVALEPLAEQPHFTLKFEMKAVELKELNDFLRAYGHVDVSSGTLQMYMEAKAKDGNFDGYVKPFFQNLDFHNEQDKNDNLGKRIWESVVSGFLKIVKNHERNEVATQVPFSGKFDNPSVGVLATIGNLIENGFGRAFSQGFNTDKIYNGEKKDQLSRTTP